MIYTIATAKGGAGKTTTAAALAQLAAIDGRRVLAVDLDPQGCLTTILGAAPNVAGAYQLITGETAAIQKTAQGVDVIAAAPDLATLTTKKGSALRLASALEPFRKRYSFIFLDLAPFMSELTFNALQASDRLIIPTEADIFNLQGLYSVADLAAGIQKTNERLKPAGVLITRYDGRSNINRYMRDKIIEAAAEIGAPYLGEVRKGAALVEAQATGKRLEDYAPKSKPAEDYRRIYAALKGQK